MESDFVLAQVCDERSKNIGREVRETKDSVSRLFSMSNTMHSKIMATLAAVILLLIGVIVNIFVSLKGPQNETQKIYKQSDISSQFKPGRISRNN